jgi:hypothetical protein
MSNNDVQIVILIAVRAARNQIIIEKWVLAPIPASRRDSGPSKQYRVQVQQAVEETASGT